MEIKKISEVEWKIPKESSMEVDVRIFASESLLDKIKQDKALSQASNMASLPKVLNPIVVCPDAHVGYGFCIGGVAAFDAKTGIISPGKSDPDQIFNLP